MSFNKYSSIKRVYYTYCYKSNLFTKMDLLSVETLWKLDVILTQSSHPSKKSKDHACCAYISASYSSYLKHNVTKYFTTDLKYSIKHSREFLDVCRAVAKKKWGNLIFFVCRNFYNWQIFPFIFPFHLMK